MGLDRAAIVTLGSALPPAVGIFGRLESLLARSDTDLDNIVDLVRVDPALTFQIIRLGNSAFYGLKNRCASSSVRTWKNWMISRQGPQWKAMRGTSVFVISPEQRGQSGFMEVLESCRGDTTPGKPLGTLQECNPNSLGSAARICPLGSPILTVENRAVVEAIHPEIRPVVTAPQKRFDVGMRASREQATALERPVQKEVLHGITGGEGRSGRQPSRPASVRQSIPHSGINTTQRQSRQ